MSEQLVKEAISNEKLKCPECKKPIRKYDKYADTIDSVRDGFNIVEIDSRASRVTLICNNEPCAWKERTEYWTNYEED
jgi:hypothetical protein